MPSLHEIKKFQKKVFSHYKKHERSLPFRKTTDPYAILLSEIMLQQTQVERGVRYYERWLRRWPTIHDLAKASRIDVLKEWLGLGYNNRAKNLHETAKIISEKYRGEVLLAIPHYKELPGIGPYTSAAVQIFAANMDIVTVDTNIRRILIHEFDLSEKTSDKELWKLAEGCLPKGRSRDWHNALMDYGATLLTSRKTGIRPKTRQSKFEGSDRQVRAKVLRMLLFSERPLTLKEIGNSIGRRAKDNLKAILEGMKRDGLLIKTGERFSLSNEKG